ANAVWTFEGLAADTYAVYVAFPTATNHASGTYTVSDGGVVETTVTVDQRDLVLDHYAEDRFWQRLDYVAADSGTLTVELTAATSGWLIADAVMIDVTPVNNTPTVTAPIGQITVDEDAADTQIDLSTVFDDVEPGALTYTVEGNTNGSLVAATIDADTLTLDYQPNLNGTATIVIRATDAGGLFAEDTVALTVNPVNDAPVANYDSGTVYEDSGIFFLAVDPNDPELQGEDPIANNLLNNDSDVDGDLILFDSTGTPEHGVVIVGAGNDGFEYDPNGQFEDLAPGETATDTVTYTISDGNGGFDTATLTITILGEDDPTELTGHTVNGGTINCQFNDVDGNAAGQLSVGIYDSADNTRKETLPIVGSGSWS
ncbi:hypothetical protein LCGC14_2969020, partial [marine sediment metagenome]